MTTRKQLIVNADDFGLTEGINEGIAIAHERGILTSASLMVRWPAAEAAAAYAGAHPELSVGLHLDLGEWIFENDEWRLLYEVVPLENSEATAQEIERQLTRFVELTGRQPTHLDSHQHVHESEPVRSLCLDTAKRLNLVVRNMDNRVRYCGSFYGQSNKGHPYSEGISEDALIKILQKLPAGITELGCHPAKYPDMPGMYRDERVLECATLCQPSIRTTLSTETIDLCSFKNCAWPHGPDDLIR